MGDIVAAAQASVIADAVNGDGFTGIGCHGINGDHLAGGGADIARIVNHAKLIVIIAVRQRAGINPGPAQSADADIRPGYTAIEADLRVIATPQRRTERPFQADLVIAGDKVAARQTGILTDGIDRNGRRRRRGEIHHHVLAVRCPYVTRVINHADLVLIRTVRQGAAIGVAPGGARDGQVNPACPAVHADLRFLVIAELRGQ